MNTKNMNYVGPRAMNDYTADSSKYVNSPKFEEPQKVAMCIWTSAANEPSTIKKVRPK